MIESKIYPPYASQSFVIAPESAVDGVEMIVIREVAKVVFSSNDFILPGLNGHRDVMNVIKSYLDPVSLKKIAQVCKAAQKWSRDALIEKVNEHKWQMSEVGFNFNQLEIFLQKNGHRQEYLALTRLNAPETSQQDSILVSVKRILGLKKSPLLGLTDYCPNLWCLGLRNCKLNDKDIKFIASSPMLTLLTFLDLGQNTISSEGAKAIAASKTLTRLIGLLIEDNKVGTIGATAIAASAALKNLEILDLVNNAICDNGAWAIATSKTLKNLTDLWLNKNNISDRGMIAIAKSETLESLKALDIQDNKVSFIGAKAIATFCLLKNLTWLDLSSNNINDEGVEAIATSETLKNLVCLRLAQNPIGSKGAKAVAASKTLTNLEELNFGGCRINK